ncbi:MAG: hypothetical protein ACE5FA_05430 [Dehalococcoidia bacterium]
MATANLATYLFEAMREDLSPGIRDTLPKMDPLFDMIWNEYEGVVRAPLGRPAYNAGSSSLYSSTWVYRWIWAATGGGAFKFTNPAPNLTNTIGDNVAVYQQNAEFPGATDYVAPRYANPFIGLIQGRGTIGLPWQLLRANRLDSILLNIVGEHVKNSAKLTAHSEAICWYSRNPSWAEVVRTPVDVPSTAAHRGVGATDIAGTANTANLTFKTDSASGVTGISAEDTICRLQPGLSVDIWELILDDDGTGAANDDIDVLKLHAAGWVVDQVDFINEAVTFVTKDGAAADNAPSATGAATDWITYVVTIKDSVTLATNAGVGNLAGANTTENTRQDALDANVTVTVNYGSDGIFSFIKTAYTDSLYGISMTNLPNLMSLSVADLGDFVTEKNFNDWIGWFMNQYGPDKCFDTLITSNGVLNGFVANLTGTGPSSNVEFIRYGVDRGGKPLSYEAGWDKLGVRYRNKVFKLIDSSMFQRQNIVGLKTRDKNLKRLMPPAIPGARGEPQFQDIDFVAPLGGARGIHLWSRNASGAIGDLLEAPYVCEYQHFIQDPQQLRVRGITESTGVGLSGI